MSVRGGQGPALANTNEVCYQPNICLRTVLSSFCGTGKKLRKSAAVFEKRDQAMRASAFGGLDLRCIFDNGWHPLKD